MMPAAKAMDPVLGVDVHIIQPPGPVPPVPIPHPFVGMLIDPMDFVPVVGATILVNGMPRAIAGTAGKCLPPHIPMGGMFVKPPTNECEMFMGSATVLLDGDPASFMALPALSCQDIGMPAPVRTNPKKKTKTKSLVLPTSVVLPIPAGLPVLIGGPPTISMMAMGMKAGMAGLAKLAKSKVGKALKRGLKKLKQRACKNMKPGFVKCTLLRAEPVHIITGEVVVEQRDFTLGWRVPLDWTRRYGSQQPRVGSLGRGWETPADARLELAPDGSVTFHDGAAGAAVFPSWPVNGPVPELVAGATLDRAENGLVVRTKEGLRWFFRLPLAGEAEVPAAHVADERDNWLQFVRDERGTLIELRDSAGRRAVVTGRAGLLERIDLVDPASGAPHPLVRYEYDARGDLCAVYDALDVPYRFAYDWQRRLERHTDRTGLSFRYEYDGPAADARCVRAFGDGGLYDYRFAYEPALGRVRVTDSLGHTSVVEWNDDELPVRETDPAGAVTTYEYDEAGRCSAVVDPLGRRTTWEYDDAGNLLVLTRPDGSALAAEYDAEHRATALTDPGGAVMRFEYERGRLAARTAPRGGRWSYEYDARGDLVAATDPGGAWQRFEYDPLGNLVAAHRSSGAGVRVERDGRGNIVARATSDGARTSYRYDAKNRLLEARYADGSRVACAYDAADNLVAFTEADGSTVRMRYAGLGELAERVEGDGGRVRWEYDTEERLVAVVNERGETARYERDALGRVVGERDYWGRARRYEYDPAGRLVAATNPLGERVVLERDALDRVVRRVLPDGTAERFEYDAAGNVVRAEGAGGVVERAYDEDGNLVRETTADGFAVASVYDLAGRRTRRSTSLGNELDIRYDDAGRPDELRLNAQPLANLEYDPTGRLRGERLGTSLQRSYEYDAGGRLARQTLRHGGRPVAEQAFRYDLAGRLVERRAVDGDLATFDYDPVGRVRRMASLGLGEQELAYDAAGDLARPVVEPLAPGEGRAEAFRGVTYVYDDAGRLVRRRGGDGEARFTWDAVDRLVACVTERGQRVEFAYDPLGRRTLKRVDGRAVRFAWDGDLLAGELPDGGHAREFLFRPDSFRPLAVANGAVHFYETDQAGLPHALVDEAGDRVWQGRYDALARLLGEDDGTQPLRLQGQYADAETGLAYTRHRYYDAHVGTFVSQDPLGQRAGPNVYAYGPSVWNWVDVFGLNCKTVTVYRVEGVGNARVHIDGSGNVKIPNKDDYLYVSFRDQAHADYFVAKKKAQFPDSTIKAFDVPEDVVSDIQKKAVPQRDARKFPGAPQISDPAVAKKLGMDPKDVLGVKGDDLAALEQAAIPGSGRTL